MTLRGTSLRLFLSLSLSLAHTFFCLSRIHSSVSRAYILDTQVDVSMTCPSEEPAFSIISMRACVYIESSVRHSWHVTELGLLDTHT